jgi:creatinine amidohydrolase
VTAPALAALRDALLRAAEALPALAAPAALSAFDPRAARAFRITGVGSSAAHARYLAVLLAEELGLPARYVPLDAFPLAGDGRDVLVVFSQALSPNARLALAETQSWLHTVLVTAAATSRDAERRRTLDALRSAGVGVVDSAGGDEFGTLLRVEGPVAGYVAALRFARSLGLAPVPELGRVQEAYAAALERGAAMAKALAPRLAAEPVLLLASGSYREASDNLRLKLVEGLLRPVPPISDPIEFAHGAFQSLFERRATLLALTRPDAPHEAERLARLRSMLDPERHLLVALEATLPGFLAIFEHEAYLGALVLAALEHAGVDPSRWPGRGADGPLYDLRAEPRQEPPRRAEPAPALEALTWPELERALAAGRRCALLPLGATEQHGPHLPFATDRWIADALAERFCALVPSALRLPALALGASSEHGSFPGTLSLDEDTLAAVLADLARSLARHGFEEIFCFSAHGGNLRLLREQQSALERAAEPARWIAFTDHAGLNARLFALAEAQGVPAAAAGHHAGELEASVIAGLRPGALRRTALAPGLLDTPADVQSIFYPDLRAHAPSGTVGDPRLASPDRAALYLDAWVDALVAAYEGAKKRHHTNGTVKP